jgi:GR25 family glycosyltransferase involved in LPS biosynthesis
MDLDCKRLEAIFSFLPYDPVILILNSHSESAAKCRSLWPHGTILTSESLFLARAPEIDFIWLDEEGPGLFILEILLPIAKRSKVIYSTSHQHSKLKEFLKSQDFALFSEWDWEGQYANVIFLKKEILNGLLRSLNYSAKNSISCSDYPHPSKVENCFQKCAKKSLVHTMPKIDFIYMINLDERPEKYALACEGLEKYGVHPYRFSAVNGRKLSTAVLNELGVRCFEGISEEKFIGSVYKEIDGREHVSNELIAKENTVYFSLGMSRGAIGCLLSHLSVLQDAYDSGYKTIWVLEDDAEVLDDPKQLSHLIDRLDCAASDWDILFTDIDFKGKEGAYVPCRSLAARPNFRMEPLSFYLDRFYPLSLDFFSIGMRYGTYSMIIRRSGMEKILNYYKTYSLFLPYDLDYWLIPDLKMFCCSKEIVSVYSNALSDT